MHLLEVAQELIDHFFLCPHRDAMNDLDEEVHQTINDPRLLCFAISGVNMILLGPTPSFG